MPARLVALPPLPPPATTIRLPAVTAHPPPAPAAPNTPHAPAGATTPPWHRQPPWHQPPEPPNRATPPFEYPAPPPHRTTGTALAAVIVIALVAVFGVVGLAAVVGSRSADTAGPGYDRPPATTPSPAPTGSTTDAGADAGADAPADLDPATPNPGTVSTRPDRTASTAAPTGTGQPVYRLADNPIFGSGLGLGRVDCRLPSFSGDPTTQARFYRAAVDCLDRAWLPTLRAAGLPATPPKLEVPTGPFNTPCGNKPAIAAANYCEGTIYMPPRYFNEVEHLPSDQPSVYLGVLAHEYGHHVQELAGVMDAAWDRRYDAGINSPTGLDISRRNELLATCFGGMFYASSAGRGSITRAMLDEAGRDQARRGDYPETGLPRDHGTPANNGTWFGHGVRLNQTVHCNTWQAPADRVS